MKWDFNPGFHGKILKVKNNSDSNPEKLAQRNQALPMVYLLMLIMVGSLLFLFNQLINHSRSQAMSQLEVQTQNAVEDLNESVNSMERMAEALAVQYQQNYLQRDVEVAERILLSNLKLYMQLYKESCITSQVINKSGHMITLSRSPDGQFQLESETSLNISSKIGHKSKWHVDPHQFVLSQPINKSNKTSTTLRMTFSAPNLFAEFLNLEANDEGNRMWWLDPQGNPGVNTNIEQNPTWQNTTSFQNVISDNYSGILEMDCPWHEGQKIITAAVPFNIGPFNMSVLTSTDSKNVSGPLVMLAIKMTILFVGLMILAVWALRLISQQRKTALQKLADEKSVIEGLFHNIDDLIFQQDLSGVYTDCNKSFAQFFGLNPHQIKGRTDDQIGIPQGQYPVSADDRVFLSRGRSLASEVWIDRPNGNKELIDMHKHSLQHINGKAYGVMGIGRIKTSHWHSEQDMLKLKEELESSNTNLEEALNRATESSQEAATANNAKSEFLANMSHEIRTPLGAVIGLTDLLAQTDSSPNQVAYLNKLDNASHSLLHIINDILDFSKIEAGKMTFELIPFHLGEVISQVSEMFSERVLSRNLYFINKRDQVPEFLIGDPVRLRQILVNLLGNALKFTEKGGLTLKVSGGEKMGNQIYLVFSVKDTGIGIAPDRLTELFSSFTQADTSTTRQFGGTGLGLSISQQLAELMGGNIWVESVEGKGTTFHFTLPFEEMNDEDADAYMDEMLSKESQGLVKPGKPLEGMDILLVDDNEINREVIGEILMQRGATVFLAEDGNLAVDAAAKKQFHVVLMDMQMPIMDGPTATIEIRKNLDDKALPILALTANAQAEDKRRCLEAGMNEFMAKPVDPAELVDKILALTHEMKRNPSKQAVPSPTLNPKQEALPKMNPTTPGIELSTVMTRLGNNKTLMAKLLRMFMDQHGADVGLLNNALAAKDRQQAIHIAHALKGTAGNLSADTVQQLASELESSCRENELLPEKVSNSLEEAMVVALDTMQQIVGAIEKQSKSSAPDIPQWSRDEAGKQLAQLQILVHENDISAEDEFTRMRPGLQGHALAENLESIAGALLLFDFDAAHELVTTVLDEITTTKV